VIGPTSGGKDADAVAAPASPMTQGSMWISVGVIGLRSCQRFSM
jgi:hypothetical protein